MIRRAVLAGAILLIAPSIAGLMVAVLVFLLLPRVLAVLPTIGSQRRDRDRSEHALLLTDALAAHLIAGVPLLESLESCATADDGDLGSATRACAQLIRIGARDPFAPWLQWQFMAPLARELTRSMHTGGVLGAAAARAARAMRAESHRRQRIALERMSVRVTIPVALCLLPAFLLVAVLPPAIGIFSQLDIRASTDRK